MPVYNVLKVEFLSVDSWFLKMLISSKFTMYFNFYWYHYHFSRPKNCITNLILFDELKIGYLFYNFNFVAGCLGYCWSCLIHHVIVPLNKEQFEPNMKFSLRNSRKSENRKLRHKIRIPIPIIRRRLIQGAPYPI